MCKGGLVRPPVSPYLERDLDDKLLFGVCSGLGAYFGVDPALNLMLRSHDLTWTIEDDALLITAPEQADALYDCGFAMLAWLRAHSSDWGALAELPQAEAIVRRYLELGGDAAKSSAHVYLGILLTLRPPSLGGKPEEAREHFEKAIALSGGRDLSAKVEFAKGYAKMMYDRDLYDRLVSEVLDASPYAEGFTLMNVLAQKEAVQLRAEADDYF